MPITTLSEQTESLHTDLQKEIEAKALEFIRKYAEYRMPGQDDEKMHEFTDPNNEKNVVTIWQYGISEADTSEKRNINLTFFKENDTNQTIATCLSYDHKTGERSYYRFEYLI